MLQEFETYLLETQNISKSNREACMRVVKKLSKGTGIKHKNKPDEVFCKERRICLEDDLEQLRLEAKFWLPYQKSDPTCLDRGHGWALNHPIARLIDFKNWKMRPVTTSCPLASSDAVPTVGARIFVAAMEAAMEEKNERRTDQTNAHSNTQPTAHTNPTTHTNPTALVVGAASSGADRSEEIAAVGDAVMDIDFCDDEEAGAGSRGTLTLYGDGADVPYNPPMATEFQRLARTCYMNLSLSKYLKRKNMHNSAHPQMKKTVRDFYVANPAILEPTGLTIGTFSVDHVIPENLGGLNHVANFHLMPPGVNSHFRDTWTAAKIRYIGTYAARGALSLHKFFHRDQYTYDFSKFNPHHSI